MSEKVHVIRAAFAPNSVPTEIGMQWNNTLTGDVYKSTGTALIADWKLEPTTGSIDHTQLLNKGTFSHSQIDDHINSTTNPHGVDSNDVGASSALWNANKLQDITVHNAAPNNGDLLRYNAANTRWEGASASALDELVKVSGTDTLSGNLNTKITTTSSPITKTIVNGGANETLNLGLNQGLILHSAIDEIGTKSHATIDTEINALLSDVATRALKTNVLEKDNTASYTPSENYHPATKLYVDSQAGGTLTVAPNEVIPLISGRYYPLGVTNNTAAGAIVGIANITQMYPVVWPQSGVLADLSVICTTLGASRTAKIVIYDTDANGYPSDLIVETAALSLAAAGIKTIAFTSFSFTKGKIYWVGVRFNGVTAALRAIPIAAIVPIGGMGLTSLTTYGTCIRRTLTDATPAPATWTWNNAEITNGVLNPAVYIRV